MGVYTSNLFADTKQTLLKEQYIYGMKRVGAIHTDKQVFGYSAEEYRAEVLAYTFNGGASTELTEHVLYSENTCGNQQQGELQISPEGDKLFWYKHEKNVSAFKHRLFEIYSFSLDIDKLGVAEDEIEILNQNHHLYQAGNYGRGMFDLTKDNNYAVAGQRGVFSNEGYHYKNTWRYDLLTPSDYISINPEDIHLLGQIRRGKDGKLYIPNLNKPIDQMHTYRSIDEKAEDFELYGFDQEEENPYYFTSSLPTQVYKLFSKDNTLTSFSRLIRQKQYEITDHLGNVRLVISDAKLIVSEDHQIDVNDYYTPDVLSFTDYSAFGVQLPGRSFNSGDYRYGFNGMEKDDEVKGSGNSLDFGARIYDPRVGRWLSLDPKAEEFPSLSDYSSMANNPILFVDPDGEKIIIHYKDKNGNDKSYEYGSSMKKPDNDFVLQTIESLDHLKTTNRGNKLVSRIETDLKNDLTLTNYIGDDRVDNAGGFFFTPDLTDNKGNAIPIGSKVSVGDININSGSISWDPYSSIRFNDETLVNSDGTTDKSSLNASISPATALGHEMGHAYQAFYSTTSFMRSDKPDPQYGNYKERFAIEFFEHPIAQVLGEGKRLSHNATEDNLIQTSGPTSNRPLVNDDIGEGMKEVEFD